MNISLNNFSVTPIIGEIGDILIYSFTESGGRIAIDATEGFYPDYNISNQRVIGKLHSTLNQRFSILLQTGPIQKSILVGTTYNKYYDTPGYYTLKTYLQGNGPYSYGINVVDGKNFKHFIF